MGVSLVPDAGLETGSNESEAEMAARLGNVLYWLGSGIAAILFVLSAYMAIELNWNDKPTALGFLIAAVASWLLGRALRYILAGI